MRQEFAKNLPLIVRQVRGIFLPFRVGHRYDSFRSLQEIEGCRTVFHLFWEFQDTLLEPLQLRGGTLEIPQDDLYGVRTSTHAAKQRTT